MDTAALLGGKEYLVEQFLDEKSSLVYTDGERQCLHWALNVLWGPHPIANRIAEELLGNDHEDAISGPKDFTKFVTEHNLKRLPRILSTGLLYCGRYDDTLLIQNPRNQRQRILVVNLKHFPYIDVPFGEIPGSSGAQVVQCSKIAIVYIKLSEELVSADDRSFQSEDGTGKGLEDLAKDEEELSRTDESVVTPSRGRYRKISHCIALEREMLSKIHFVAVLPTV